MAHPPPFKQPNDEMMDIQRYVCDAIFFVPLGPPSSMVQRNPSVEEKSDENSLNTISFFPSLVNFLKSPLKALTEFLMYLDCYY